MPRLCLPALPCLLGLLGLLVSSAACTDDPDEGTSVGNPGLLAIVAADSDEIEVQGGHLLAATVGVEACTSTDDDWHAPGDVALGDPLDLPAGTWCIVWLGMDGIELDVASVEEPEEAAPLLLDVQELDLAVIDQVLQVTESDAFVLELGSPGWLDGLDIDPEDNPIFDEEVLAELVARLDESRLFADPDGDGTVSTEERDAGALAAVDPDLQHEGGAQDEAGAPPSCGGCSTAVPPSPPRALLTLLLVVMLAARRRRS